MTDLLSPKGANHPKITAADMRVALKRHFPHPECGIVFEVAQSTGFAAHRHLDAIAMETWPSRGLALHGIEIKVDLADWRREKRNPEKAEQLARFCDYFWIAAPRGLIPRAEMPSAWGLLELGPRQIEVARQAQKTKAEAIDRNLLAAVFRAAGRNLVPDDLDAALSERRAQLEADFAETVKREIALARSNDFRDAENWRDMLKAVGLEGDTFHRYWQSDPVNLSAAVKMVRTSGIANAHAGLTALRDTFAESLANIEKAINGFSISHASTTLPKKKRGRRDAR